MPERDNLIRFRVAAALAVASGGLDEGARDLLAFYGRMRGLDPEEVDGVLSDPPAAVPDGLDALNGPQQVLADLVLAFAHDMEISERERELLLRLAPACGLPREEVEERIELGLGVCGESRDLAAILTPPRMPPEQVYRLLVLTSIVDGKLAGSEKAQLVQAADRMGLSRDQATRILNEVARAGRFELPEPPADHGQRLSVFHEMLNLVQADGRVAERERKLVLKLAKKWGLEAQARLHLSMLTLMS